MIITCPACENRYVVDSIQVSDKMRKVRCVQCKHVWELESHAPSAVVDKAADNTLWRRSKQSAPNVNSKKTWPWFALLVVATAAMASAIAGRNSIMNHWPATASMYKRIGFHVPVPGEGLQIFEVKALRSENASNNKIYLKVVGKINNASDQIRLLPQITIEIEGACKDNPSKTCVLQSWKHKMAHSRLLPKEVVEFESEAELVVDNPEKVTLSF